MDLIFGAYVAGIGISDEAGPGDAAIGFQVAAVYVVSAVHGMYKSRRCRRALERLGERQALLSSAPRPVIVYAIVINPLVDTLTVGERVQLVATAHHSSGAIIPGREFVWSSSDTAVASVSTDGLVSGRAPGSATIAAKTGDRQDTATIVVAAPR